MNLIADIAFRFTFDPQSESNIFCNGHMREEGIFLEYGIQLTTVWRKTVDIFSIKNNIAGVRCLKATENT